MSFEFPVLEILSELKAKLSDHPIVILQAPPGAGKSTVLPLHLLDETWLREKKTIMLEPRRLAARSVAHRLASLSGEAIGEKIGYRIRFEANVSARSLIEVVTEGILTRMIQGDNALEGIGLVIFDEFHERSLQADLALALCLQVQKILRSDLRILIMSATLDGDRISNALGGVPIVTATGKQFAVEHRYDGSDPSGNVSMRMARAIRKALIETTGDILAFFPGAGEISRTADLLEKENVSAVLYPLFGDLPMKKQQEAIMPLPDGRRKVVLATSIAETSLTIEGVSVVIDSGYSRVPRFDPRTGLNRLETIRVTRDAADQRAGRAGRLGPGICYRLWSEGMNGSLVAHRNPEIMDADLAPLMLELAQWGITKVDQVTWITTPPAGAVSQAIELLEQLEALADGRITDRGKKMLQLPTHPRIAHMLLSARDLKNANELVSLATDIAALLEERDPLPKESGADLALRVEVLRKWRRGERISSDRSILERIERLAASWRKLLKASISNQIPADTDVGQLLALAYPERIARQVKKQSERYKLTNGKIVVLPQHDPLMREEWLSVAHLDAGAGEGKIFLAAAIHEDDLLHLAHETESVVWDADRGMVVGALEKRVGNLVLQTRPLTTIPDSKRLNVLYDVIRNEGLKVVGWSEDQQRWQARVMSLRSWRPEESWPDVSDEKLLKNIEEWLTPFLKDIKKKSELVKLDFSQIVSTLLPWEQSSALANLAPEKLQVPSGSMIRIDYFSDGRSPVMEVRLQELFGLLETPVVNGGRTRIVLHLLSPGYKPVQVTQDLKSFWQTTYHEVRKELKRRYPKHSWPEDPWTAKPVRKGRSEKQ